MQNRRNRFFLSKFVTENKQNKMQFWRLGVKILTIYFHTNNYNLPITVWLRLDWIKMKKSFSKKFQSNYKKKLQKYAKYPNFQISQKVLLLISRLNFSFEFVFGRISWVIKNQKSLKKCIEWRLGGWKGLSGASGTRASWITTEWDAHRKENSHGPAAPPTQF